MSKSGRQEEPDKSWWFNTKTQSVEFGLLTAAPYRIGPFETEGQAKRALDVVRERSRLWSEDDYSED